METERAQLLGSNQRRGRKDMSVVETSVINELILETHRIKGKDLCVHQDDCMGCYNRIIRNHAILNSRKFGIKDNICKLHCNTHNRIQFKNQI